MPGGALTGWLQWNCAEIVQRPRHQRDSADLLPADRHGVWLLDGTQLFHALLAPLLINGKTNQRTAGG